MIVVAVAGMSDFSTASTNFCWMIGLREKRLHVLVWVAYLILISEPAFDMIFLIKVLLMTELTIFTAGFRVWALRVRAAQGSMIEGLTFEVRSLVSI